MTARQHSRVYSGPCLSFTFACAPGHIPSSKMSINVSPMMARQPQEVHALK